MKAVFKISAWYLLTLLLINSALASEIDGKWTGKMPGPEGEIDIYFDLKVVKSDSLTGTVKGPMGITEIQHGKVTGKDFSFELNINGTIIKHSGFVEKDTMKVYFAGMQGEVMEIKLTRIKSTEANGES
jgi:hypothetical protein